MRASEFIFESAVLEAYDASSLKTARDNLNKLYGNESEKVLKLILSLDPTGPEGSKTIRQIQKEYPLRDANYKKQELEAELATLTAPKQLAKQEIYGQMRNASPEQRAEFLNQIKVIDSNETQKEKELRAELTELQQQIAGYETEYSSVYSTKKRRIADVKDTNDFLYFLLRNANTKDEYDYLIKTAQNLESRRAYKKILREIFSLMKLAQYRNIQGTQFQTATRPKETNRFFPGITIENLQTLKQRLTDILKSKVTRRTLNDVDQTGYKLLGQNIKKNLYAIEPLTPQAGQQWQAQTDSTFCTNKQEHEGSEWSTYKNGGYNEYGEPIYPGRLYYLYDESRERPYSLSYANSEFVDKDHFPMGKELANLLILFRSVAPEEHAEGMKLISSNPILSARLNYLMNPQAALARIAKEPKKFNHALEDALARAYPEQYEKIRSKYPRDRIPIFSDVGISKDNLDSAIEQYAQQQTISEQYLKAKDKVKLKPKKTLIGSSGDVKQPALMNKFFGGGG